LILPSFSIQIFNTITNSIEAALLVFIAIQTHLNNQAVKEKQFTINTRLDHILDTLVSHVDDVKTSKKGNKNEMEKS
jgi:hypothetical protein